MATRTLKMSHDVLCVKYSNTKDPSKLLVAASLLDNTVKIFYEDSLRFFLSLYGHKLPVLSLSISSDNKLIVTGSADKNIKIWGLDFGDCHKSFFAHADSVMSVSFVANTHYVFTCGKDGVLKYWDADRFELITQTNAHFGEAWCLTTSHLGDFVVTAGHDRAIRVFLKSNEPVILTEEREKEEEENLDRAMDIEGDRAIGLEDELQQPDQSAQAIEAKRIDIVMEKEGSNKASTVNSTSMKGADYLISTLQRAEVQRKAIGAWKEECEYVKSTLTEEEYLKRTQNDTIPISPPPAKDPFMLGLTPCEYVASTISNMARSEIEGCLLVLPFENITQLVFYLTEMLKTNQYTEMCIRSLLFIFTLYEKQLESSAQLQKDLLVLKPLMKGRLSAIHSCIGVNQASLSMLKRKLAARTADFEDGVETKKLKQ